MFLFGPDPLWTNPFCMQPEPEFADAEPQSGRASACDSLPCVVGRAAVIASFLDVGSQSLPLTISLSSCSLFSLQSLFKGLFLLCDSLERPGCCKISHVLTDSKVGAISAGGDDEAMGP